MFRPNNSGLLSRRIGTDVYGKQTFSAPKATPCAVVDNLAQIAKTPVRSDSSASRAAAEEKTATVKILFPAKTVIGSDDKFEIEGLSLRVISIQKRRSVTGLLDHLEIDFDIRP